MELSKRLQQLRKQENYSQEQLAEALGISRQAVSKWESGQGYPDIGNIIKLAELYNVSTDYLLLGKKEDTPSKPESEPVPVQKTGIISQKAIDRIAIIAALALITVLFIAALGFVDKLLM